MLTSSSAVCLLGPRMHRSEIVLTFPGNALRNNENGNIVIKSLLFNWIICTAKPRSVSIILITADFSAYFVDMRCRASVPASHRMPSVKIVPRSVGRSYCLVTPFG